MKSLKFLLGSLALVFVLAACSSFEGDVDSSFPRIVPTGSVASTAKTEENRTEETSPATENGVELSDSEEDEAGDELAVSDGEEGSEIADQSDAEAPAADSSEDVANAADSGEATSDEASTDNAEVAEGNSKETPSVADAPKAADSEVKKSDAVVASNKAVLSETVATEQAAKKESGFSRLNRFLFGDRSPRRKIAAEAENAVAAATAEKASVSASAEKASVPVDKASEVAMTANLPENVFVLDTDYVTRVKWSSNGTQCYMFIYYNEWARDGFDAKFLLCKIAQNGGYTVFAGDTNIAITTSENGGGNTLNCVYTLKGEFDVADLNWVASKGKTVEYRPVEEAVTQGRMDGMRTISFDGGVLPEKITGTPGLASTIALGYERSAAVALR